MLSGEFFADKNTLAIVRGVIAPQTTQKTSRKSAFETSINKKPRFNDTFMPILDLMSNEKKTVQKQSPKNIVTPMHLISGKRGLKHSAIAMKKFAVGRLNSYQRQSEGSNSPDLKFDHMGRSQQRFYLTAQSPQRPKVPVDGSITEMADGKKQSMQDLSQTTVAKAMIEVLNVPSAAMPATDTCEFNQQNHTDSI